MGIKKNNTRVWAFIPARGGSKSIPLKNLADLNGMPLMSYCVISAKASNIFERIICSTDHDLIAKHAEELSIEVDRRPLHLGGDDVSTKSVILEFLLRSRSLPDYIFIVEPTSPFLRVSDICGVYELLKQNNWAVTGQTICKPPHTHHAWNQRVYSKGMVSFLFEERKKVFAKQNKPELYIFGNLIACKVEAILQGGDVFSEPSIGLEIDWPYDLNIDHRNDLIIANLLLKSDLKLTNSK